MRVCVRLRCNNKRTHTCTHKNALAMRTERRFGCYCFYTIPYHIISIFRPMECVYVCVCDAHTFAEWHHFCDVCVCVCSRNAGSAIMT